jgi:DNA-binding LytR/AlgR family response regulator
VEKDIRSDQFIRISQSFLVNSHFIREIHKKQKKVHLEGAHVLPFTISVKKLGALLAN